MRDVTLLPRSNNELPPRRDSRTLPTPRFFRPCALSEKAALSADALLQKPEASIRGVKKRKFTSLQSIPHAAHTFYGTSSSTIVASASVVMVAPMPWHYVVVAHMSAPGVRPPGPASSRQHPVNVPSKASRTRRLGNLAPVVYLGLSL